VVYDISDISLSIYCVLFSALFHIIALGLYNNLVKENCCVLELGYAYSFVIVCILFELITPWLFWIPIIREFREDIDSRAKQIRNRRRKKLASDDNSEFGTLSQGRASVKTSMTSLSEADTYRRYAYIDDVDFLPVSVSRPFVCTSRSSLSEYETYRRYTYGEDPELKPANPGAIFIVHNDRQDAAPEESVI